MRAVQRIQSHAEGCVTATASAIHSYNTCFIVLHSEGEGNESLLYLVLATIEPLKSQIEILDSHHLAE